MKIFNKECVELEKHGGILKNKNVTYYFKPGYILHREDGPAKAWANGNNFWWYNGELIMETFGEVTPEQLLDFRLRVL